MSSISYSHYSMMRQCGELYRISVIEKAPQAINVNFEFGSALHAGLNTALEVEEEEAAHEVFEAYWNAVADKGMDYDGRYTHEALHDMGLRFVSFFRNRLGKKMKLIEGETRLFHKWDDTTQLEGTPDALVEYDGKNVLLDFKSSAYSYLPEKTDASLQLNLYAWLLEQSGHRVDKLAFVVFIKSTGSLQTLRLIDYDADKAKQMIGSMVNFFKRNQGHYEKNPLSCTMGKYVCQNFKRCWGG